MIDSFQPIEKPNLRASVVKQIEDLVRAGHLGPTAKLPPERELQRQLKVSRPLLREALHELTISGLIEVRHGRGRYIAAAADSKPLSRPLSQYLLLGEISIAELLQTRNVIEGETALLAAEAASSDDIVDLYHMLDAMEAARECPDEHIELDTLFHARIATIACNRLLRRILDSMHNLLTEYRRLVIDIPGRIDVANQEHARIVTALATHDKEAAAAEMRAHLQAISAEVNRFAGKP